MPEPVVRAPAATAALLLPVPLVLGALWLPSASAAVIPQAGA
jgi:hypothetical protein